MSGTERSIKISEAKHHQFCTKEAKNEEIDEIKKLLKYDVRFISMGLRTNH